MDRNNHKREGQWPVGLINYVAVVCVSGCFRCNCRRQRKHGMTWLATRRQHEGKSQSRQFANLAIWLVRIATTVQGRGTCSLVTHVCKSSSRFRAFSPRNRDDDRMGKICVRASVLRRHKTTIRWWHPAGCHHRIAAHTRFNLAIWQSDQRNGLLRG